MKSISCTQIPHDAIDAPLLPPDIIFQSQDNSVDGTPRTTRYKTAMKARTEYKRLSMAKSSVLRQRKFVFGALYDKIYDGFFEINPLLGDFDLIVTLQSNQESNIQVRLVAPDEGIGRDQLLSSAVGLGKCLTGSGNARGSKVGDVGSMHAIGLRSSTTKEMYVSTDKTKEKVKTTSQLMRHWMEDNMKNVLTYLLQADEMNGNTKAVPFMPTGPGSRLMVSVNLGNAPHYDTADMSMSVAIWVEELPGVAENWFFVLPNISYRGSNGVLIRLHHGVVISWDARVIYHCTSKTNTGPNNRTFACMWASGK